MTWQSTPYDGTFGEAKARLVEAAISLDQFLQVPDLENVVTTTTQGAPRMIIEKVNFYQESSDLRDKNESGHFSFSDCAFRIRLVDLGRNGSQASDDDLAPHIVCVVMYNLAFLHQFTSLLRGCLTGLDAALRFYELSHMAVTGTATGRDNAAASAEVLVVGLNNMGHIHSLRFDGSQIRATVLRLIHLADSFCVLGDYNLRATAQLMCCYAINEIHAPSA
jgi:hypothetical protein